ncbi:MAG: hypothetical protein H8E66_25800 [Planctomycetes bacterium]|nr:hypothetical protein [Planctomycetota bacterium]
MSKQRRKRMKRNKQIRSRRSQIRNGVEQLDKRILPGGFLDLLAGAAIASTFDLLPDEQFLPEEIEADSNETVMSRQPNQALLQTDLSALGVDREKDSDREKNEVTADLTKADNAHVLTPESNATTNTLVAASFVDSFFASNQFVDTTSTLPIAQTPPLANPSRSFSSPISQLGAGVGRGSGQGYNVTGAELPQSNVASSVASASSMPAWTRGEGEGGSSSSGSASASSSASSSGGTPSGGGLACEEDGDAVEHEIQQQWFTFGATAEIFASDNPVFRVVSELPGDVPPGAPLEVQQAYVGMWGGGGISLFPASLNPELSTDFWWESTRNRRLAFFTPATPLGNGQYRSILHHEWVDYEIDGISHDLDLIRIITMRQDVNCTGVTASTDVGDILDATGIVSTKYDEADVNLAISTLPGTGTQTIYTVGADEHPSVLNVAANYPNFSFTAQYDVITSMSLNSAEGWEDRFGVYENGLMKGEYATATGAVARVANLANTHLTSLVAAYGGGTSTTFFG